MDYVHLTVKVDTSTPFYKDFIEPLREDRSLSAFVMEMLECYYADDKIKDAIYEYNNRNSVCTRVEEQLQRIALAHSQSVANTNIVSKMLETPDTYLDLNGTQKSDILCSEKDDNMVKMLSNRVSELSEMVLNLSKRLPANGIITEKDTYNSVSESLVISDTIKESFVQKNLDIVLQKPFELHDVSNKSINEDKPVVNISEVTVAMENPVEVYKENPVGGIVIKDIPISEILSDDNTNVVVKHIGVIADTIEDVVQVAEEIKAEDVAVINVPASFKKMFKSMG